MRIAKQVKNKFKIYLDKVETTPEVFNEDIDVRIIVRNSLGEYWVNDDEELEGLIEKVNKNDFPVFTNIFIYSQAKKFSAEITSKAKIEGSLF